MSRNENRVVQYDLTLIVSVEKIEGGFDCRLDVMPENMFEGETLASETFEEEVKREEIAAWVAKIVQQNVQLIAEKSIPKSFSEEF